MSRPLRVEVEGAFYHVLNRGNARGMIFHDDADRAAFLDRLGRCAERFELDVLAYVLMGNHYHLLVRTRRANLSAGMQWLGGSYTAWHHRRHQGSGHLFQGRFKSFLVRGETYLYRLLLYIHRNPLRAKMVGRLGDYRWSSYRALAFGRGGPAWFEPGAVHRLLDLDAREFRRAVGRYDEGRDNLLAELHYGLVLGSAATVETLRRTLVRRGSDAGEQPQLRRLCAGRDIEERVDECRQLLQMDEDECRTLRRPRRRTVRPRRDLLIYLLWRTGDVRLAEIGAYFRIGYPAVSLAKTRARHHLKNHKRLQRQLGITV